MLHPWRLQEKTLQLLLQCAIGFRDALVLSQVLHPRLGEKRFDESTGRFDIFEHVPRVRAVAATLGGEGVEQVQELRAIFRGDAVLDGDHDGTGARYEIVGDDWRRPMHRRCEVQPGRSLQLGAPGQRNRDERERRCDEVSDRQARDGGDLAPRRLPIVIAPKNTVT